MDKAFVVDKKAAGRARTQNEGVFAVHRKWKT